MSPNRTSVSSPNRLAHSSIRQDSKRFSAITFMRTHRRWLNTLLASFMGFWQVATPLSAATVYWDADGNDALNATDGTDLGGTGTWDTSSLLWWPAGGGADVTWANGAADIAIFSAPFAAIASSATVTLGTLSGVEANQLRFNRSGYTLAGGDFTLLGTTPSLYAELGVTATINSQILGTEGLTKSGGGTIRLASGNTYTGTTILNNGALIITDQSALGGDSSAIIVTRINPAIGATGVRGFGGGSLVLDGTGGNVDISRDLILQGNGPWSDRGAVIVSTGINTLSGTVEMGGLTNGANVNTRIIAADGTLNLTGTLNILGTAATTISQFGGVNQAGASFYNITGVLAGTGTVEGSGGGTLFLNPTDSSGFSGTIRVSGSAASGQSVVRIDSAGVLGTRTSTTTNSVIDMNGGVLAVLMDSPDVRVANGTNANVYGRASSTFFADHTPNSSVRDQTVAFGQLAFEENITLTFNSRNGYGMSFGAAPVQGGNNNSTFTNNLQGGALLTFTGNFWSNTDTTSRTLTLQGTGNTLLSGNLLATAAGDVNHNLRKKGVGTLTISSTGATLDGNVFIDNGTLVITDFRSITNNTEVIHIGSNASNTNLNSSNNNGAGVLVIGTGTTPTVAGLTTSKVINLAGTTNGATILANQNGSNGVILNADFTATGAGSKTLILGGANISANTINGAIVNNSDINTTALTKVDGGRWVLAGTNTYTGNTTISNGTLQLKANAAVSTIIADTSAIVFNATNVYAGGTLEFLGQASTNSVETLGALTPTNGSGTIKLTPGSGGTASIVFASLGTVGGGGTVNIVAPTAGDTVSFTTTSISNNIANAGLFYNGSNFAFVPGAGLALRAPDYTSDADFVTSTSALTTASNMEITGAGFSNAAVTIDSLRINGATTLNMTGLLTIRTAGATNASGGIIQTGGSGSITGTGVSTGGSGALVINVDGGANSLQLDAPITSTTTGGFTKVGAGTLRLGGANNQAGTISINEGTVRLTTGGRLGASNAALTIRQDGILELNGITPATNTGAFNNNGIVRNTSASTDVVFTVGGGTGTGTSYGIIEDGGAGKVSVVKVGTGAQSWLGLSTYTGTTTIGSTGIVTINNLQNGGQASGIGASSNAAGNLIFNGASATQAYGGISFTGTTNDETDRLFTFGGTAANSGARIQSNGVNNATSSWTNTGDLAFGTANIAQGLVLGGASTGDNRFSPRITDNGTGVVSVYKADAGVWYLEAMNTYSGVTQLNGGTLYAQDGTNIKKDASTGSNIVFNGGNFAGTGAFSRTIGTAGDQMQWIAGASGGFSAGGSSLTVDWGTGVVWGSTVGFLDTGALLLNNSGVAKSDVTILSDFDLGGGTRTVTVGDFTSIGADFATLAGAITNAVGTGNLVKNGAGILNLRGDNTYNGTTTIIQGTLVVTSLGNSANPGQATSVGTSTGANLASQAIILSRTGNSAGILEYVGLGETSDRFIQLGVDAGTGNSQIHADGVGGLILTNVNNTLNTNAKTLFLRGVSSAANMITSQLSDNTGALGITIDGSTAWILTNGANDYSGTTTVGAGALGIGHNGALGTGNLDLSNGSIFAYGGDRTITNAVRLVNNTGPAFMGDYSLTFTNALQVLAAANNVTTLTNNVVAGKSVTFAGVTANSLGASRTWTIDGSGMTIFAGDITTSTAFGLAITKTGDGTLVLGGSAANNFNQASQNLDIDRGTLRIGGNEVIGDGAGFGSVILSPELAGGDTAVLDLNGFSETINGLTMNTDGTAIIDNTSANAASLTFGANNSAVSIGGGTGTYIIQNSGGGALSIVKTGNTNITIPTGVNLNYTGTTAVNGGTLTIASPLNGTTGLSVTGGSTLRLTGGLAAPAAVTSVVVDNGSTLSLLDGAGNQLSGLTSLQLGSVGGTMTTLNLNVGDLNSAGDGLQTDTLSLVSGTLSLFSGNQITLNLTDAGLNENQQYVLLDATAIGGGLFGGASPLSLTDYILGATPGGFSFIDLTTNSTTNQIILTTGSLITGSSWWNAAGTLDTWTDVANWSVTDKSGTNPAISTPGQGTDVIFIADNITGGAAITTTLEQNFKINSLTFEASTNPANTPASVTIDPGAVATNRLVIAPQNPADGIRISAGGPAAVTISGLVRLGANQTWEVVDASSVLSIGSLLGEANVTKSGAGKVTLTSASDPTFNTGVTATMTINAGTLELLNVGALGNTINSNLANVIINGGAFYYNGTAGTVANALTLGGSTLSAGAGNQTYSGAVNVSGNSFINMRDSNSATLDTTARNITLSGQLTGNGGLTVDSINTVSAGNQITGSLTLNNADNSGWSGTLNILRGSVTGNSANALGTGAINIESGKVSYTGVGGTTYSLNKELTIASASGNAVGEWNVDRTAGSGIFTVTNSGTLTLGGAGGTGELRIFLADTAVTEAIFTGIVTLANNGIINVRDNATSVATISGNIGEIGGARTLTVNQLAAPGTWGGTGAILRLTGLNTFTGDVTLGGGILEFDTVTGVSGAASSLGRGTAINVSNSATLSFIGTSAQTTDRAINSSSAGGVLTLSANGTGVGTKITYAGGVTIANTATGSNLILTGTAGSEGVISGGISQTGDLADMTVNGATWTHQDGTSRIGDDMTVTGANSILNLNSGVLQVRDDILVTLGANLNLNGTGVLSFSTATLSADASLRAYTDGVITIGANNAVVVTDFDGLRIGTDGAGLGTLVMNANQTVTEFILGNRNVDRLGLVNGAGRLTVTGNLDLYKGTINANLASSGSTALEKIGNGTVTLAGDNSGLASTGATIIYEGDLILDYTTSNTTKLRAASALDMRGGNLTLNGNAIDATAQSVGSFTLASGGSSRITLSPNGQNLVLNLNAITRGVNAQDGTIRFVLPAGVQSATHGITTDTLNTIGAGANAILGGWATVDDGTGVYFARNLSNAADGNIGAAVTTTKDAVGTWITGENISDSAGLSGTLFYAGINSLRFNAASGSDLLIGPGGVLTIASGGILVTSNVGGTPSIMGGTLVSGVAASGVRELIIIQDSTQTFEIGSVIRADHAVTKSGAGTLRLSGNNEYTGYTEIQEGVLQVSGGNAIGDTSLVTLSAYRNSSLELLADETIGRLAGGGRNTDSEFGVVAVGGNTLTINQSANATYAGFFTGTGNIVLNQGNSGNLNLTNVSSGYTGVVTVDGGLFQLSGIGQINASVIRINKGGNLLLDNNSSTRSGTRILDTSTVTLNSADGGFSSQATVRGLAIRTDQNANTSETIGTLNFATGASYVTAEASGGSSAVSQIIANDFVRLNNATVNVRGRFLGATSGNRTQMRIGDAANQSAFIANASNLVGGSGIGGTKNIKIVPWAIGESFSAASVAASNMGNSLVTYDSGAGFRPLAFATEYNTYSISADSTENIRESLSADLTGLSGKTVNALVLDNVATSTVNVTGSGVGQTLSVTSGALLFTISGSLTTNAAYSTVLGGFDDGISLGSGTTGEYVIHVVNPNSGASLTGGVLTLGSTTVTVDSTTGLTAGMPVFGQGIPLGATVSSVTSATQFEMTLPSFLSLGSQTFQYTTLESLTAAISSPLTSTADITKSGRGTLVLSGGALSIAGGGSNKTTINEGTLEISDLDNIGGDTGGLVFAGGTLRLGTGFADDLSTRGISLLLAGGTIDTNGISLSLSGGLGSGLGGLTLVGGGVFTVNGISTYSGATSIVNGGLILNGGASNRLSSATGLTLGGGMTSGFLQLGDAVGGVSDLTVASLATLGTGTGNAIIGGAGTASVLTINQAASTDYAGRIGGSNANENNLSIVKSGTGTLTLSGADLTYTGTTTVSAGVLNITGSPGAALTTTGITVAGGATLNLLNGGGQAIDLGSGVLDLGAGLGTTTLGFELGSTSAYDRIITSATATTSNTVLLNLVGLNGAGAGDYDLLVAGGGLNNATYSIGMVSNFTGQTLSLTVNPTVVRLTAAASTGEFYWLGRTGLSWAEYSGLDTNWSTDLAGTLNANGTPGAASSVIFSAQNAPGPDINSTLDAIFSINDLQFRSIPSGVTSVSIAPGVGGTLTLGAGGITVEDNAGSATISAPITLGASQTWNVVGTGANGSALTVTGVIDGTADLTKTGGGVLTLSGTHTYVGATIVDGGVLQAGATNGFNQTSAHVVNAGGTLRLNNFAAVIGSLAGSGTVETGLSATANRTLTLGGDNTSTVFSGTLQNGGPFALGLTKVGAGVLTLSGSNTYTGTTTVRSGVLNIAGITSTGAGAFNVADNAGARAALLIGNTGDLTTTDIDVGSNATAAGAVYQSGGTVTISGADATNRFALGNAAEGYGYYEISDGVLNSARLTLGGNNHTGNGVFVQTGGTVNIATWSIIGHGQGSALLDISGGTYNSGTNFAFNHISNSYSVVNIRGTGVLNTQATNFRLLQGNSNSLNNTGILNLLSGGTLRLASGGINNGTGTGSSGNVALANFNGGTIITNAASTTLVNLTSIGTALTSNSGAYIYSGGLTVDTNGFNSTLPAALLAPTGEGVATIAVTDGGSGYIGAPLIKITGGSGVGATAVANMIDDGAGTLKIGSITITNPGTGYVNTDTLTLEFEDNSSVYTTQATLGAVAFNGGNTSGGLTKTGLGTLTLSGANTYTGGSTVTQGTLALGASNVLADAGNVTINGGTFDLATFSDTVAVVSLRSGSITGSTGVLTSTSAYDLRDGSASAILSGGVGANKTTSGTVTLSGANTFTGAVAVTEGTLAFSSGNNLGNGSATNTITVNGGTLRYEGTGAVDLGVTRGALVIGSDDATLNAASSTGVLTVSGGINGTSGGDLIKAGAGSVIIGGGAVDLNGGAVTVSAGLLSAGFTSSGASAVTVSSAGTLHLVDNSATTLDLGAGTLNLADGARLGFELGTPGTSDLITMTGAANVTGTITLDFFNLGSLGSGTYNLLQAASGLDAATYVLGNAPTGFNYTINKSGNLVSISTEVLIARYWKGLADGSWSTVNAGANFNWSTLADGSDDSATAPGAGQTVIFSASNAAVTSITTTLDGDFTIDSLQFKNSPVGITDVTISQGTSGTLTLTPASSTNGILVEADAGLITISAPLVLGAAQTWNVSNVGDAALVVSGGVTFSNGLTKTGAGALTLSGANTGAGGVTIIGGTLNINSTSALGSGVFSIGAGTTLDNSTTGAITLSTAPSAINLNGSFTFTGTQNLNLGSGDVALNSNASVTTSGGTLTFGGSLSDGAGSFGLNKDGAGTLTINGASNEVGGTLSVAAGTLNMSNGTSSLGALTVSGGTANLNGSNTVAGAVSIFGGTTNMNGGNALNGGVSVTAGILTMNGANTITGSVVNVGGTVTLGGANSITGGVTNSGTLNVNNAGALGSQLFTINGGTINNTSGSTVVSATNNAMAWNSSFTFTGGSDLELGTGAVTLGNNVTVTTSANTLTVGGVINDGVDTFNLTKAGAGTLRLTGLSSDSANNYSGTTILGGGTTAITGTAALAGGLTIGSSNTSTVLSTLNLDNGTASFGGNLIVQTNSTTANMLTIGAGQSLNVSGNVTIGSSAGSNTTTKLTATGLGAFNVTNTAGGGLFTVGGTSGTTTVGNIAEADFSGLATMNVTLTGGSSVITVNPNITTGTTNVNGREAILRLAATSTLTAATLNVGGGPTMNNAAGQRNELILGSNSTLINVNTFNVGAGARDIGYVGFNGGTGSVTIRAQDGSSRAAFNVGTGTASTGVGAGTGNLVDFSGHSADLLLSTLTIGGQNRNANRSDVFTFDTGILDATTVVVGDNGGTANATDANSTWTSTLNIGGGTTTIGTGGLEIAKGDTAVTGSDTLIGVVNVTGGNVTIANSTGLGAAVRLANNTIATGLTTDGEFNITGGTVTVAGNIIKGASTGAGSATVKLGGGTLDLAGNNIGAGASNVTFNAEAGTLKNLAQLNGGGTLTKTTAGLLVLEGANTYTGATDVNAGILQVGTAGAGQSGSGTITVANGGTLAGTGTVVGGTIISSGGVLQAGDVTMVGNAASTVTSNGKLTFTAANTALNVQDGGQIRLGLTSTAQIDGSFDWTVNDALTYLDGNGGTSGTAYVSTWSQSGDYDSIKLTNGTFTLGSTAGGTIKLIDSGTTSYSLGQIFKLLDWSTVGSSNSLAGGGAFTLTDLDISGVNLGGLAFDTSAFTTYGVLVIVPEPSRALLLLFGVFGLMMRRRRLKQW